MGNSPAPCCCEMKGQDLEVVQIQTRRGGGDPPDDLPKLDLEGPLVLEDQGPQNKEKKEQDDGTRYRVRFPKDDRLGAEIAVYDKRGFAVVRSIAPEGLIARWNVANPERQVLEGSYVLEANGIKVGDMKPKELEDMIAISSEVDLLISTVLPII
mmetsp:Transcript_36093/g.82902  ORF Transcript_36093/g.82902 Transcript_36093/m.82902 type:complete len:155 (-) Transcript_36093:109-573(-)